MWNKRLVCFHWQRAQRVCASPLFSLPHSHSVASGQCGFLAGGCALSGERAMVARALWKALAEVVPKLNNFVDWSVCSHKPSLRQCAPKIACIEAPDMARSESFVYSALQLRLSHATPGRLASFIIIQSSVHTLSRWLSGPPVHIQTVEGAVVSTKM